MVLRRNWGSFAKAMKVVAWYIKKHLILSYFYGLTSIHFFFVGIGPHFITWSSMFCTRFLLLLIKFFWSFADKQNKGTETDGLLIDDDSNGPGMDMVSSHLAKFFSGVNTKIIVFRSCTMGLHKLFIVSVT